MIRNPALPSIASLSSWPLKRLRLPSSLAFSLRRPEEPQKENAQNINQGLLMRVTCEAPHRSYTLHLSSPSLPFPGGHPQKEVWSPAGGSILLTSLMHRHLLPSPTYLFLPFLSCSL